MDTLLWYAEITLDYVLQMLPCAAGAAVVFFCLLPRRRKRLAALGLLRSGPAREAAGLLFVLFCAGLGALTLFPANFWTAGHWSEVMRGTEPLFPPVNRHLQWETIQWIPFREIAGAFTGPWRFFMLLGNGAMFLPLGFFPALLWREARWPRSVLTGLCSSAGIELTQFFIGRGTDIDDVIVNTLGALCGYWLFLLLRRAAPRLANQFRCTEVEPPHG